MEKFYLSALEVLKQAVSRDFDGKNSRAEKAWGLSNGILGKWFKGERNPSIVLLAPILDRLDITLSLPSIKRLGEHSPVEAVSGERLPTVPVHLAAGAGLPVDIWNTEPTRCIPVLPQYYQKNIAAVEVMGDSMEPTIRKGAFVGVVPMSGDLKEGDVYLVRRPPFGLLVKRVRMNENGEIILTSDNPAYPPQVVPFEGYEDIIIGHVVWCWQNM